jgi:hypothetical protein
MTLSLPEFSRYRFDLCSVSGRYLDDFFSRPRPLKAYLGGTFLLACPRGAPGTAGPFTSPLGAVLLAFLAAIGPAPS